MNSRILSDVNECVNLIISLGKHSMRFDLPITMVEYSKISNRREFALKRVIVISLWSATVFNAFLFFALFLSSFSSLDGKDKKKDKKKHLF